MMKIAIGAGLVWLLIFAACAVLTRIPPRGRAAAGRGLATASQADFARIRVGELVQVSAAPRSRTLTGLDFIRAAPGRPR
jgi:hypothetical protein